MSQAPTEISLEDAIEKFGLTYTDMKVTKPDGFPGHNMQRTESLGGEEKSRHNATVSLPDTLRLPLEVEQGSTIYALRVKRNEDGSVVKGEDGQTVWEQVTDEVTGVFHIDPISPHSSAPQNKGLTHSIIWETQQGMRFQAPLVDNPQTYDTQYVFASAEKLRAFVENVHKSDNQLLQGLHGQFNSAVFFNAANDLEGPAQEADALEFAAAN
jgi:hypothetical protein